MARFIAIVFAVLWPLAALPAFAQQFKAGDIMIDKAWSRATPKGAAVGVGYLVIHNHGATADKLTGGSADFAIGAEYRSKPDNLGIAREDDSWDLFAAFFPTKNVSLTVAYVDLGNIVIRDHQRGFYAALQAGF